MDVSSLCGYLLGHVGIRRIEIADDLARNGTGKAALGSGSHSTAFIKAGKERVWTSIEGYSHGWRVVGEGFRQVRDSIHRSLRTQDALSGCWAWGGSWWGWLVGLLTGHSTRKGIFTLIGVKEDSILRKYDMQDESSLHILCECGALAGARQRGTSLPWGCKYQVRVLLHLSRNPGLLWAVTVELQKAQKAKVSKFWDSWCVELTLQGQ